MQCVIASLNRGAVGGGCTALAGPLRPRDRVQGWVEQKALALRSAEQHELFHRKSRAVRSFAC